MQETDLHYPPETCPFCNIAAAFPFPSPAESSPQLWTSSSKSKSAELASCIPDDAESAPEKTSPSSFVVLRSRDVVAFLDILPMTGGECLYFIFAPSPNSLLLSFLLSFGGTQSLIKCDNLGHLLVTTRQHKVKVADMGAVESREIGERVFFFSSPMFWTINGVMVEMYVANREQGLWLPLLARTVAKVTGVTDYNIVQNNGKFISTNLVRVGFFSKRFRMLRFLRQHVLHNLHSLHMLFQ